MAMADKFSFDKLNQYNWQTWKFRMEMLLIREELWYVIDEDKPAAVPVKWSKDDRRARSNIGLSLEDNQLSVVRTCKSAKECWDALKAKHEKNTVTSRVSLLKKLCSLNLAEGGDVENHLAVLEDLFDRLENSGMELQEPLRIAMILRSLPDSYDSLATALESRSDADLTMELVKSKLLDDFERRKERSGELFDTKAMKSALQSESGPSERVCYYCKKPGHLRRQCRLYLAKQKGGEEEKKKHGENSNAKQNAKHVKNETCGSSVCFMAGVGQRECWYIDSGASCHMTSDKQFFVSLEEKAGPNVILADGKFAATAGCGDGVVMCVDGNGNAIEVKLSGVLYVPSLTSGLVSVDKLTAKGFTVKFWKDGCSICDTSGKVVVAGVQSGSLYKLKLAEVAKKVEGKVHNQNCQHLWHKRFGHRDPAVIPKIVEGKLGVGVKVTDCGIQQPCEPCLEGKSAREPIPKEAERKSTQVLDLVHTDLCGPMRTTTPGGKRFLMTMIDDYSRFTIVYLLEKKSEAAGKIKEYVKYVENLFGRKPRVIRSDGGGEYANDELRRFFAEEGIKAQYTTAYTPQQNGVAERKNRSLQEMATTMLLDAGLDKRYWGEACVAATYLQNRLPSRSVDTTPYEKWCGRKPELGHLKAYGCPAYVHIPGVKRGKFESKARKLTFIGYSEEHKGYRFVDTATDKVTISRDAKFLELQDPECASQEKVIEGASAGSKVEWDSVAEPEAEAEVTEPDNCEEFECENEDKSEEEELFELDNNSGEVDPLLVKNECESASTEENSEGWKIKRRSRRSNQGVQPGHLSDYVVGIARADTGAIRKSKCKKSGGVKSAG